MENAPTQQVTGAGERDAALRALVSLPGAACPHCGYSLEGLAAGGAAVSKCPECGGGLEAGLVRGVGSRRMRRVMTLMFAWLAFAGCMNATRRGIAIFDFIEMQSSFGTRSRGITVIGGQIVRTPGPLAPAIPATWWLELGGWSVLGLLGLWGIVATAWLMSTVRREKRLIVLLVLGFIAYWGYHGCQFVFEIVARW